MSEDIVNPKRYTETELECWDFWLEAGLNPIVASAVKYVWRYKHKNGLDDLKKAEVFIDKAFDSADEVYYSEKAYRPSDDELKPMSDYQINFMIGACMTNLAPTYKLGLACMSDMLNEMMKEYESNND